MGSEPTKSNVVPIGRPQRGGQAPTDMRRVALSRTDQYLTDDDRLVARQREFHSEDFHVAISDENGHDTKVAGIRFHPMMANEMNMVLARGSFPIDSVHDLIRISVFEFMKKLYLLERDGGIPNYIARLSAINRISLQSRHNREFEDSLKQVEDEAQKLVATGKLQIAAMFVHDVLVEAKQIPQKTWRDFYVDRLMTKFGALLKAQGKSVKLKRRADDR